jgi:hypothetical protein
MNRVKYSKQEMTEYPLFTPPESLAVKGTKNWTKLEAQAYFDWFMEVRKQRVSNFLDFIRYNLTGNVEHDLVTISQKLFDTVNTPDFYSIREIDGAKKLNDYGLAIAADMGLLLAQLLEELKPSLYWKIGKGPKSYHGYNLPIMKNFFGTTSEVDLLFFSIIKVGVSLNVDKRPFDWLTSLKNFEKAAK